MIQKSFKMPTSKSSNNGLQAPIITVSSAETPNEKSASIQKVLNSIASYDSTANNGESIDEYCRKIRFQQSKLFAISKSNGVTSTVPTVSVQSTASSNSSTTITKELNQTPPVVMRNKPPIPKTNSTTNTDIKRKSLNHDRMGQIKSESPSKATMLTLIHESKLGRSKSNLSTTKTENSNSNHNLALFNDGSLQNSAKKWTSMYALRDSIRNLTACVSSKAKYPHAKKARPIHPDSTNDSASNTLYEGENDDKLSLDIDTDSSSMISNPYELYDATNSSFVHTKDQNNLRLNPSLIKSSVTLNDINSIANLKKESHRSSMINFTNLMVNDAQKTSSKEYAMNPSRPSSLKLHGLEKEEKSDLLQFSTAAANTKINAKSVTTKPALSNTNQNGLLQVVEKEQCTLIRIESQRCDLNLDNSISNLSPKMKDNLLNKRSINSISYSPERLKKLLAFTTETDNVFTFSPKYQKTAYPMISLPDSNMYWYDGWALDTSLNSENVNEDYDLDECISFISASNKHMIICLDYDRNEFLSKDCILDRNNLDFYGQDIRDCPLILSYHIETLDNEDHLKAVLRTKEDNNYITMPLVNIKEPVIPHKICKFINPSLRIKFFNQISIPNGARLIKNFDDHINSKQFKFGVIYMKQGQTNEEELFSNQTHSESFDEFLGFIGKRIKLKDFKGYKGGLDTQHGQTGDESIYEVFHEREIMFHVSTLLPFNKLDNQQLERKRHIGNDIVTIIYQEENTPFAPDMIASNFLHAFIIIQKIPNKNHNTLTRYRVGVSARNGVPNFTPEIPNCATFEKSELFKEWLLMKLINAQNACCEAEKFRKLKERTRCTLLDELFNNIHEHNQKLVQALEISNSNANNSIDNNNNNNNNNDGDTISQTNGGSLVHKNSLTMGSDQPVQVQNSPAPSTGSFKFSILNTVRKAFSTKSTKQSSQAKTVQTVLNESTSSSSSSANDQHATTSDTPSVEKITKQRIRSVTMESGNSKMNLKKEPTTMSSIDVSKPQLRIVPLAVQTDDDSTSSTTKTNEYSSSESSSASSPTKAPDSRTTQANMIGTKQSTDDSDTGLGSLTPNSGLSSSTSFTTDPSMTGNEQNMNHNYGYDMITSGFATNTKNVDNRKSGSRKNSKKNDQSSRGKRSSQKNTLVIPNEIF